MKKLLLLSFLVSIFVFISCDETETFDDTRKLDNEAAFAKISTSPDYKKIESKTGAGHIMYKVLKEGEKSDVNPLFTDQVRALYTGWYKFYWIKDNQFREDEFIGDDGNTFKNKYIFDSTANRGDVPSKFAVNRVVDGFSTALQHMHVGDKWEVWMPRNMGYGSTGNTGIPAYCTLVFEIELVEILN